MPNTKLYRVAFPLVISLLCSLVFVMPVAATEEGWNYIPLSDKQPSCTIDLTTEGNLSEYAIASVMVVRMRPDEVSHLVIDTNTYEVEVDVTKINWYTWQVVTNYTQGDVEESAVTNISEAEFVLPSACLFVCVGKLGGLDVPILGHVVYSRGVFVSTHTSFLYLGDMVDFMHHFHSFAKVIDTIPVPPTKSTVVATFDEPGDAEVQILIEPIGEAGRGWTGSVPTALFDWCADHVPYVGVYIGAALSMFAQLLFMLFGSTEEAGLIPLLFTNFWILYILFLMYSLMHAVSRTGRNLMTFFEVLVNDHVKLFTLLYDFVLKIFRAIMNVISTIAAAIKP